MSIRKPKDKTPSGSPSVGEPEYLIVGLLRRPFGLKGELVMEIITDFPERLKRGTTVYVGASHDVRTIDSTRKHAEGLVVKFEGVDSPEAAGDLRKQPVWVRAADRPALPKGMFYHHQLVGFSVLNEADELIGTLSEILETGANDVYVVSQEEGGEILLPAISSVVLSIDPESRRIRIREMPGLLDGNRSGSRAG